MGRRLILALVALGALIVAVVGAFTLVGGLNRAPSESMVPTIQVGDRFGVLGASGRPRGRRHRDPPPARRRRG